MNAKIIQLGTPLKTHSAFKRYVCNSLIIATVYTPLFASVNGTNALAQSTPAPTTSYLYDAIGNNTQVSDPRQQNTNYKYDAQNRRIETLQPAATANGTRPKIDGVYDGLDQVTRVTDPRNLATVYTIDGLGNETLLSSPDTGATARTFDEDGNVLTSTDARGKVTTFSYDALNRVKLVSYTTGIASAFEYDGGTASYPGAVGQLTRFTDESGSTMLAYDAFGRLAIKTQIVHGAQFVTAYTYLAEGAGNGKLGSLTYPSGNRVNYLYDPAGALAALTLNPGLPDRSTDSSITTPLLTDITYHAMGMPKSWRWGNDAELQPNLYTRTFDLNGRLTTYPLGLPGVTRTVVYDTAGRITSFSHIGSIDAANLNQTFGYDNLNRLISFVSSTTSQSYAYDLTGNRTSQSIGGASYALTTAATSNRLSSTTGPMPAKSNTFQADGAVASDGTISYVYSDRGRMSRATKAGIVTDYSYNAIGQRVRKAGASVEGGMNFYVYDDEGRLLGEYEAGTVPLQETVFLGDTPVAVLANGVSYIYADHINTPRAIVSSIDSAVSWRWDDADPFGLTPPVAGSGLVTNYNPRFPGQLYDQETGNHYNYFRDYDPQTGRYLQSDPIGIGLYTSHPASSRSALMVSAATRTS